MTIESKPTKKRLLPKPTKQRTLKESLERINKRYGNALARLAK